MIPYLLTEQRVPGLPLPFPLPLVDSTQLNSTPLHSTPPPVCHPSDAPFSSLSECCAAFSSFRFLSVRFSHTFCSLVDNEQLQHYDSASRSRSKSWSRSSFRGSAMQLSWILFFSVAGALAACIWPVFSPLAIRTQAFLLKFHVRTINFPALCTCSIRLVVVFMQRLVLFFFRF